MGNLGFKRLNVWSADYSLKYTGTQWSGRAGERIGENYYENEDEDGEESRGENKRVKTSRIT